MNGIHRIRVYKWNKIDKRYYRSFFINPANRFEEVNCIIVDNLNEACDIADIVSNKNKNLLVCVFKNQDRLLGRGRVEKELDFITYSVSRIEIC